MRDYIPITNDVTEVARGLKLTEKGSDTRVGHANKRANSVISDILARKRSGRPKQYETSDSSGQQSSMSLYQAALHDSIRRSCVKRSPFGSPFAAPIEDDVQDDGTGRRTP